MSFLQPAILLALPVIALPIVIHLINQRRFQTVNWAAMHFLLAANRMSRGYARLRQWLILSARTLAVAGLVFAISRPLSSGWLGWAGGGRVDTTIILLDRSASMSQVGAGGESKLQAGLQRLSESLGRLQSDRYVMIESGRCEPIELAAPELILEMPETSPISESADLPAMLEVATEYIRENRPSRCEVWICSDVRRTDWKDESGRWTAIRESLLQLPQMVRYHLLAYPETAEDNRSIRVTRALRVEDDEGARLLISFRIEQRSPADPAVTVPIQLEIDGARSEFSVDLSGSVLDVRDHVVPLDGGQSSGWGRLSIPSDAAPFDNESFFVYDQEVVRRTLVVGDQIDAIRPVEFAASVAPSRDVECGVKVVAADDLIDGDLDEVGLLVWQAAIPLSSEPSGAMLEAFARRGGSILFLPNSQPNSAEFAGVNWGNWSEAAPTRVATWVDDRDLFAKTKSGQSLPLGELDVSRSCAIEGKYTALATLDTGEPFVAKATTPGGNVYFCATTAAITDSSLASDGVVLFAMLHRALDSGTRSLGNVREFIAGSVPRDLIDERTAKTIPPALQTPSSDDPTTLAKEPWRQLAGPPDALSSEYWLHAGVYKTSERLFAINRSEPEDLETIVPDGRVSALFAELDFSRVDDRVGSDRSLIQEVWRLFLLVMLAALLMEAMLCLPRSINRKSVSSVGGAT